MFSAALLCYAVLLCHQPTNRLEKEPGEEGSGVCYASYTVSVLRTYWYTSAFIHVRTSIYRVTETYFGSRRGRKKEEEE